MKKIWKKSLLFLLMGVLIFSLCSCVSIKDIKKNHAFWGDLAQTSIIWQEQEYIRLDGTEESSLNPINDYEREIHVTEADVPTLLSDLYGTPVFASTDGILLQCNVNYYCRADRYQEMAQRVAKGFKPETLGYDYNDKEYNEKFQPLTEAENIALLGILERARSRVAQEFPEDYFYASSIYWCSKDGLFREYYLDLICVGEDFYFETYEKNPDGEDEYILFSVAEEDRATVNSLFEKALTYRPW